MGLRCDAYELIDEPTEAEPYVRARNIDGALVAIHVVRSTTPGERPHVEARFQALRAIAHPHLATVLDRGIDPSIGAYLVSSYVEGMGFDVVVPRPHRLGAAETVLILEPILSALAVLHRASIAHGNVRADRIRCSVTGAMTLVDPWPLDDRNELTDDVRAIGELMRYAYRGDDDAALDHLIAICTAEAPASRPADCGVVLERVRRFIAIPIDERKRARVALITDPAAFEARRSRPPAIEREPSSPSEPRTPVPRNHRQRLLRYSIAVAITLAVASTFGLHALHPDEPEVAAAAPRLADPPASIVEPSLARIPISPDRLMNDDPSSALPAPLGWGFRDEDPALLEQARRRAPTPIARADAEAQLGMHLLRRGHTRDAYRSLSRALRDDPDHRGALYAMFELHQRTGHIRESVPLLRHIVRLEPESAEAWTNLSIALCEVGDDLSDQEAMQAVGRALTLSPELSPALRQRCVLFARLMRADTDEACDAAIRAAPSDPVPLIARGQYLGRVYQYATSFADLDRAIALAPDDPSGYAARAGVSESHGDLIAAERDRFLACRLGDRALCATP